MKRLSLIIMLFTLPFIAQGADIAVYPVPQKMQLRKEMTRVQQTKVHVRRPGSSGDIWKKLPDDREGAYALTISPGKVEVWANDELGVYYAKQTLTQLLQGVEDAQNAQKDPFPDKSIEQVAQLGELPIGHIEDWPDLPFRGTVEGYYGTPWSAAARQSQFEFYGRNKMNTYIYAPKDDPFHHGMGCYQLYPAEKAQEIRALVQHARKNHVRFVWAIHPANTVRWEQNDGKQQLEALCDKFKAMYDLGVRDFGVLVDDSGGEICKPERQSQLANYLLENFIRKHKDVNQTLVMCPTGYNRSWTNENFLQTLGNALDPTIPVMWTGNTVVNNITLDGQRWVNEHVKRPTFIWWNWPCSDFKRSRLSMGRTYGLDTNAEMKKQMSGFVANPMEQAEASKVGLFGVANYTWNITAFDSETTWREGVARLYPKHREAMQVFCCHNSWLLPNGHGYFREESVDMYPKVQDFLKGLQDGSPKKELISSLYDEYQRMENAGEELCRAEHLGALREEIAPWFTKFHLTGKAGKIAMTCLRESDQAKRLGHIVKLGEVMTQMKEITRNEWNGGNIKPVKDVEVAMYAMTPAMQKTVQQMNRSLYATLSGGKSVQKAVFTSNRGDAQKAGSALDDDDLSTFWSNGALQEVGDWLCLDLGAPTDISRVNLVMGGSRAKDHPAAGQFEIYDGKTWRPVGDEKRGAVATLNLPKPVRAQMIRYRITQKRPNWLSVCEFTVNRPGMISVNHNLKSQPNLSARKQEKSISVNRVMELFRIEPGEFIELEVPTMLHPAWVELNLDNADLTKWAKVELVLENDEHLPLKGAMKQNTLRIDSQLPKEAVRALRVTHTGSRSEEIKLTTMAMGLSEEIAAQNVALLTDGDLTSVISCDKAPLSATLIVPKGAREAIVVGSADCTIAGATGKKRSAYVRQFKLPTGAKQLRLTAPRQQGKVICEVILK